MYDPGADALARYPEMVVRHRELGGVPAAMSRRQRVILIETSLSKAERRCALAHEVAHLDLGHAAAICEGREERHADELAAHRLLPLAELADVLCWALGPDEVSQELDVTEQMVRARIRALTDGEKRYIEEQIARRGECA